jgi:hypothetical protein
LNILITAFRSSHLAAARPAASGAHVTIDPSPFLTTIVTTSAALVAIIGGLLVAKFVGMDSDQQASRKIRADAAERLEVARGRAESARQRVLRWEAGQFFRMEETVRAVVDTGKASAAELVKIAHWPHASDELTPFVADVVAEAERAREALTGRIHNPGLYWGNFFYNNPDLPGIQWPQVWQHVYDSMTRKVAAAQKARRQAELRDRPFAGLEAASVGLSWTAPVQIPAPGFDDRETATRRHDDLRASDARAQQQVEDLEAELHRIEREHTEIVRPDGRLWSGVGILIVFTLLGVVLPLVVMATGPRDLVAVRWVLYPFIVSLAALVGYIVRYLRSLTRNKPDQPPVSA